MHVALLAEMDAPTLYRILRLRSEVFVVEQDCAFLDLDGRDLEVDALQLWCRDGDEVTACARLLRREGGDILGRIATAPAARGRRLGEALVRHGLTLGRPPILIHAQSRLRAWYETLGFAVDGDEYVEDGIPHVPMRAR